MRARTKTMQLTYKTTFQSKADRARDRDTQTHFLCSYDIDLDIRIRTWPGHSEDQSIKRNI